MVRAKKSTIYVLVDRLIRLVLNLLVLTLWNVYFQHETYCSRAFFHLLGHVLSVGGVTLLGLGCVWRVVSGTQYWAMWSNDYWHTFKPIKPLKSKSKNHNNCWINVEYVFNIIVLINSCNSGWNKVICT